MGPVDFDVHGAQALFAVRLCVHAVWCGAFQREGSFPWLFHVQQGHHGNANFANVRLNFWVGVIKNEDLQMLKYDKFETKILIFNSQNVATWKIN
jgi:hypothetical protein